MAAKGRILVLDDDEAIRDVVKMNLETEGYEVDIAEDGESAIELFAPDVHVMAILDIMLPGIDGCEVARQIRSASDVPIMMLSARDTDVDMAVGLGVGADDYLTKPFSPLELTSRVKAHLRRYSANKRATGAAEETHDDEVISAGPVVIDTATHTTTVRGEPVDLTSTEFEILKLLAAHPARVYTKAQIYRLVWDEEFGGDYATVQVHVRRLRAKIEKDPSRSHDHRHRVGRGLSVRTRRCDMTTTALVSAAVAVLVAGAAAILYAVAHSRQRDAVRRVREAIDDLAGGNLARRVTLPGRGDVSDLADAVNHLAEEMQTARAEGLRREEAHRQLISNLSHDLRTPITSITGYVDALQRGIGEDSARHVQIIATKTSELARLADDLFYLTRLDSGDLELDLQSTDAGEIARESLLGFEQELRSRDIEVIVDIPEVVCPVMADEAALGRIIGNFMANSLKHARSMTRLGIDVGNNGAHCSVTVWDDGEGFSKGVVELIERGASVGPGGGSGLGLSIAHDLAGRMHATVQARSEPRVRTAVTISLPLLDAASDTAGQDV